MNVFNKNLYGCWKMSAMRFLKPDETWESEVVMGGASFFTEAGYINTFTRTSELGFGYSGSFTVKGNDLVIHLDVCSIASMEKRMIIRTIKSLSEKNLTLSMVDEATGRKYEIDFEILTRSFVS